MKLDSYFQQAQLLHFKKGHIILRPDDTPSGIYYIEKGHVCVYSLTEWGDEKLHLIFKETEMFPLFWIFDNTHLIKYYEAVEDVSVRIIPKDEFLKYIKMDLQALREMMQRIIQIQEVYSDRIDTLEYTNAYSRLISRLIYLAKRFGEKRGTKILISIPLTHKDLAYSVAMTRETASREFEKLERKNIVKYVKHFILINDIKKLEKELSSRYDIKLM